MSNFERDAISVLHELREIARIGNSRFPAIFSGVLSSPQVVTRDLSDKFLSDECSDALIDDSGSGESLPRNSCPQTLRRLIHELRAPVESLIESELLTIAPDTHIFDALKNLEENEARAALVQATRDTILGVVAKGHLEELLSESSHFSDGSSLGIDDTNHYVTAVMSRNISIETSRATILEVIERMTIGGCPFVVIVNEAGHPCAVIDPYHIVTRLPISLETLEELTQVFRSSDRSSLFPKVA